MPPLNLARIGALVAVGSVAFVLAPAGCKGGWDYGDVSEGDRCNPYDAHNECGSGLQCTVSSWQVANQGTIANTGTLVLSLQPGAGTDNTGAFNVLPFCPENYCCPVDSNGVLTGTSGNPNCQPGCNGGAAALCSGGVDVPPYTGACAFLGLADAGSGSPEAGTPEASTPEASTPEASTPEASTPEASTPAEAEASTPADGSGG